MCILIVKPRGAKMPPLSILENCAKRNPDGCGLATADKTYKAMNFRTFAKHLAKVSTDEAAIIHFRYATHGSVCRANCHPFRDEQTGIAFAHNGVLSIRPIGNMTDSETAFRYDLLPIINEYGLYSREFAATVREIIGGSKFAFITPDGDLRTFGQFIEYDGCFYSNYGFMLFDYMSRPSRPRNLNIIRK